MSLQNEIDGGIFLEWMHHSVTAKVAQKVKQDIDNATIKLMAYARASSDPQVRATVYDLDCLYRFYNLMTEKPEREKDDADGDDGTRSGDAE